MQARINNSFLNQLKQIFDMIEPYNPNDNIGYRSLKNIGVWLIAYALTEKSQQLEVVQNLLLQAKSSYPVTDVKNMIDLLSDADNLTSIINDYMKANGTFDIIISDPARLDGFKKKAIEVGLSQLIEKHLKVDPSKDADFVLDMNNTLRFSWKDNTFGVPEEHIKDKNTFNNEKMNYLTANNENHVVWYNLVKLEDDLFHVVRLGALQNDDEGPAKETAAYLIEPADQKTDPTLIQKNYFDIISLFQKNIMIKERCDELKKVATQYDQSLKFKEEIYPKRDLCFTQFNVTVHFPEIAGPLKTEEHRLGVYSGFLGKTIGSFYTGNLEYLGKRELVYDAKGGTIKNVESLDVLQSGRSPGRVVTIEYTVKGPYAMVYEAENGADYYPFKITTPRKDLEKTFESSESYDQSNNEKHETSAKVQPEVSTESLSERTSKRQKTTVNPVSDSPKKDAPLDMKPVAKKQAESIHSMLTRSKTKPYKQTRDSVTYLLDTSEEKPIKKRQKVTEDPISTSRHQVLQRKAGSSKKLTFLRDYNPGKDQTTFSGSLQDQLMTYHPPHNLKYDSLRKMYYYLPEEDSDFSLGVEQDSNQSKKLKI